MDTDMGHWHEHNTVTDTQVDMFLFALLRFASLFASFCFVYFLFLAEIRCFASKRK
jgi:hypothetical protein